MRMLAALFLVSILVPAPAFGQPKAPPRPAGEGEIPAHELARLLQLHAPPSPESDREAAGLPAGRHPEVLTWERVYALALVRARGGAGPRADALDPKALAEQATQNGVADFGRFRKEFLAAGRGGGGGFHDPAGDFLAVLRRLEEVDVAGRSAGFYENFATLFSELSRSESGGVSPLQVDQARLSMVLGRQRLGMAVDDYRNHLEGLKVALGLSVRAPVLPDREIVAAFGRAFDRARGWQERPDREFRELTDILKGLPDLGDVVVEGRSLLAPMGDGADRQEEALGHAVRVAIRNRGEADQGKAAGDHAGLELSVRGRIRLLSGMRRDYEAQRRNYEVSIRLIDQGLEQVASPPAGSPLARPARAATAMTGLLAPELQRRRGEDRLVAIWASFRADRLALYRELGVLPYDDWKSFFDDLSAR